MSMHYIFLFAKTYNNYDYCYKITVKNRVRNTAKDGVCRHIEGVISLLTVCIVSIWGVTEQLCLRPAIDSNPDIVTHLG